MIICCVQSITATVRLSPNPSWLQSSRSNTAISEWTPPCTTPLLDSLFAILANGTRHQRRLCQSVRSLCIHPRHRPYDQSLCITQSMQRQCESQTTTEPLILPHHRPGRWNKRRLRGRRRMIVFWSSPVAKSYRFLCTLRIQRLTSQCLIYHSLLSKCTLPSTTPSPPCSSTRQLQGQPLPPVEPCPKSNQPRTSPK